MTVLHADLTVDINPTSHLFTILIPMFVIAELKDTIRIPPWLFKSAIAETIRNEINRKLANKVSY